MKSLKFISILLLFFIYSCQNNNKINKKENNESDKDKNEKGQVEKDQVKKMENNDLKILLEKQIKAGYAAEKSETDYPNYSFSEIDLVASNQILQEYLIKNGYKMPSNNEFREIVNQLFERDIDYNSIKKNLYLNFTDPCDRDIKYLKNNSEEQQDYSFYINKEGNFITELYSIPEVLDYQNSFPEIATFENNLASTIDDVKIYKWNTLENLTKIRKKNLQTILARNKFLFNNSRVDLVWLLGYDENFLINLVVKFGFDKEKEINRLVLEKWYKKYEDLGSIQTERIGEMFFSKNCDNKFSVRDGLLDYVKENTNEKDNRFIYALINYAFVLYDGDLNKIFEKDPSKIFNETQKANIVALIASIENPAVKKFKFKNAVLWSNQTTILEDLSVSHPEVIKIIIKNNYFGIKNLKEIVDNLGSVPY